MALVDGWINTLVRERARGVALQLEFGFAPDFRLLIGLKAGLGFAPDPGCVFAAGVPFGLLCRDALSGQLGPR